MTDSVIQNTPLSTRTINATSAPMVTAQFEAQVLLHPNRLAVKSGTNQITYADLNCVANRLAHAILDRRGETPEPIVLLLNRDISVITAIMGVLKAAKFYVVLEPQQPFARLSTIVADTQTNLIVTDAENWSLAEKLSNGTRAILNLDEIPSGSDFNPGLPISEDDLFGIFYTSGSTGTPKGVMDTHKRLLHSLRDRPGRSDAAREERRGLVSSLGSGTGRQSPFRSLINGNCIYIFDLERDGLGKLGNWLMEEEITGCTLMASVFRHFAMTLESRSELSFPKMRQLYLGGEPILRRDVELYKKYFPDTCILRVSFASTEAGGITSLEITKATDIKSNVMPVGYPRSDPKIFLVDENGKSVGVEQVGEIVVQSRYLSPGYWNKPELTAAMFKPAPDGSGERIYHTGDLGRMRSDGMLEHVGRKDQQIKIHGNRVEAAEVEMNLLDVNGIKDACVDARDDQSGTKELVAYLITDQPSTPTITQIRDALARKLPAYSIPSRYLYLDALPLLPNGKVDRRALPAPDARRRNVDESFVPPQNEFELELVRIWEDLLGVSPIGVTERFFDLGGHSLLAARLLVAIENKYGQKFPPRVLLEASTIEELAIRLQHEGGKPNWTPLVPLRTEGTKPPLFYIPPFNAVLGSYPLVLYLPSDQPFYTLMASPSGQDLPFTRIEDEAAFYISHIKTVQPHGPYQLMGWSYSGVTAFETAQQLFRAGERVAFLGILDMGAPLKDFGARLDYWLCRLRYIWNLGLRGIMTRVIARSKKLLSGQLDAAFQGTPSEAWQEAKERPEYPAVADRVGFRGYVAKKYPGRVTLFLVDDDAPGKCRNRLKSWMKIAVGGVQVFQVPGVHNRMLFEPNVQHLAEKLCASLQEAQSESGRSSS